MIASQPKTMKKNKLGLDELICQLLFDFYPHNTIIDQQLAEYDFFSLNILKLINRQ